VVISARIEEELSELSHEEAAEFLKDMGVTDSGVSALIRAVYHLLGLRTYLTTGVQETRAWTIHEGDKAPAAAGVIHTDFERGFIAAEVVHYDDLVSLGSKNAAKEAGKLRIEGKEYVVKDGDVIEFRFGGETNGLFSQAWCPSHDKSGDFHELKRRDAEDSGQLENRVRFWFAVGIMFDSEHFRNVDPRLGGQFFCIPALVPAPERDELAQCDSRVQSGGVVLRVWFGGFGSGWDSRTHFGIAFDEGAALEPFFRVFEFHVSQ
jgi:hypothetical protein